MPPDQTKKKETTKTSSTFFTKIVLRVTNHDGRNTSPTSSSSISKPPQSFHSFRCCQIGCVLLVYLVKSHVGRGVHLTMILVLFTGWCDDKSAHSYDECQGSDGTVQMFEKYRWLRQNGHKKTPSLSRREESERCTESVLVGNRLLSQRSDFP